MKESTLLILSWIAKWTVIQSQAASGQSRIMNGEPANVGQFPYQAYIRDDRISCGASIIHKRWLLTAAHCSLRINSGYAFVGTIYNNGADGTKITFEKFIGHEFYSSSYSQIYNDIALIRLKENIKFNKNVQLIKLARDASNDYAHVTALISGWGKTRPRDRPSTRLQYAELVVDSEEKCSRSWHETLIHKICTLSSYEQPNQATNCVGDSGGALVYKNKQIGIVSYGSGICGSYLPDVYTRVASYIPWIELKLQLYSDKLP